MSMRPVLELSRYRPGIQENKLNAFYESNI